MRTALCGSQVALRLLSPWIPMQLYLPLACAGVCAPPSRLWISGSSCARTTGLLFSHLGQPDFTSRVLSLTTSLALCNFMQELRFNRTKGRERRLPSITFCFVLHHKSKFIYIYLYVYTYIFMYLWFRDKREDVKESKK